METYPPFEVKVNKRIKLEHSYARDVEEFEFAEVREEDPLKIYPADLDSIKKETEDEETIIIKSEPDNDGGDCGSSISQNEHQQGAEPLMDVVSSEPCESAERNFFLTCTDSVNCEVEVGNNTALSSSTDCAETVPKHVFHELQQMYEVAMGNVKSLNKKLASEKKKATQTSKGAGNVRTLKSEIKKLKEQLNVSKNKVQALKQSLDASQREDVELKKKNTALRSQIEDLIKLNNDRNTCINAMKLELKNKEETIKNLRFSFKRTLSQTKKDSEVYLKKLRELDASKEAQRKDMDLKCALISQKLASTNTKLVAQQKELEKLKLDMDIMDKSIIDSLKTRQSLRDQVTNIEKELQAAKENPTLMLKLQEAQKALANVNRRFEEVQKQLLAEKTTVSFLVKEKGLMQKEYNCKFKEVDTQRNLLQTTVAALKKTVNQKMEQCRFVSEECRKLREEIELTKEEMSRREAEMKEKEEKLMSKECEYCGF